ncbi:hypothetical protein ACIGZI_36255 [Streptomyces griseus]
MPADLYTRYMGATDRCPDGIPLWERYCRLQDAYLTHLREKP